MGIEECLKHIEENKKEIQYITKRLTRLIKRYKKKREQRILNEIRDQANKILVLSLGIQEQVKRINMILNN